MLFASGIAKYILQLGHQTLIGVLVLGLSDLLMSDHLLTFQCVAQCAHIKTFNSSGGCSGTGFAGIIAFFTPTFLFLWFVWCIL